MICLVCRESETVDGLTLVAFARGEFSLIVNAVPARLCPNCGEAYLEESVAERLLSVARQRSEDGVLNSQYEFRNAQI
jgi:YgiT-type zinc finger domain-containing protein